MITLTLVCVAEMVLGMCVMSGARRGTAREFVGAVMVLVPVILIPLAAALTALADVGPR